MEMELYVIAKDFPRVQTGTNGRLKAAITGDRTLSPLSLGYSKSGTDTQLNLNPRDPPHEMSSNSSTYHAAKPSVFSL